MLRGWIRAAAEVERASRWRSCCGGTCSGAAALAATTPWPMRDFHQSAARFDGGGGSVPNPEEVGIPEDKQRREPTDRVKRMVDELVELTVLEVADLNRLLKDKLGLPDMPMGMPMMAAGAAAAAMPGPGALAEDGEASGKEAKEEKTVFNLKLAKFNPPDKIKVIKEVRAITELGLKEAKELVESAPKTIKEGLSKEDADKLKEKLESVGATIEIE